MKMRVVSNNFMETEIELVQKVVTDPFGFSLDRLQKDLDIDMFIELLVMNKYFHFIEPPTCSFDKFDTIVANTNWRLWHSLVHRPDYHFIEYGGMIVRSCNSGQFSAIVTHKGTADTISIPTFDGISIHSHPCIHNGKVWRSTFRPSVTDYDRYPPNMCNILVTKKGVIIYGKRAECDPELLRQYLLDIDNRVFSCPPPSIIYKLYTWRRINKMQNLNRK